MRIRKRINTETIQQIIVGTLVLIIILLILFAEFWLPLLNDPSISSIAYVFLPLILIAVIAGAITWKFVTKSKMDISESRFETRNVKIGLCLGSLSDNGTRILERSEYCPFNEPQLHSMLDYSAVSVLHGDLQNLIGPFPMKSSTQEEMHYISFGFQIPNRLQNPVDLETYLKEGEILGIFLLYYPEQLDSSILLRKKHIITSFKSVIKDITHVSELTPEELARIEEDIQFLSLF
ncbi:MAG: hypothetical protein ACW991_04260 [Candidatus Hodarchaeales archaeon]|jgi:hypothetical protein